MAGSRVGGHVLVRRWAALLVGLFVLLAAGPYYVNSATDTTAPTLKFLSLTPATIDTSTRSQTVKFTLLAMDDLSGVQDVAVWVSSPSGRQTVLGMGSLVSGTIWNGVYTANVVFPQYAEKGTWYVTRVQLKDNLNNYANLYESQLKSFGFPTEIEVASDGDVNPPKLQSLSFSPSEVDTTMQAQTVTFDLRVTDNLSGVANIALWLISPSGKHSILGNSTLVSGTDLDKTYRVAATLPRYSEQGSWYLFIQLKDNASNYDYLFQEDIAALGFPKNVQVTGMSDVTPPELLGLTMDPAEVDVSTQMKQVRFSVHTRDDISGTERVSLWLSGPSGQEIAGEGTLVSSSGQDAFFNVWVPIPRASEAGQWSVSRIRLTDDVYNFVDLSGEQLSAMGLPTKIAVISSDSSPSTGGVTRVPVFNGLWMVSGVVAGLYLIGRRKS